MHEIHSDIVRGVLPILVSCSQREAAGESLNPLEIVSRRLARASLKLAGYNDWQIEAIKNAGLLKERLQPK